MGEETIAEYLDKKNTERKMLGMLSFFLGFLVGEVAYVSDGSSDGSAGEMEMAAV